ncbi:MAG: hypothetical protein O3C57_04125, partial [Verrucomicrobia bacterium]|nr:hypothetical protein [Verrucomicrobiota bacterium]
WPAEGSLMSPMRFYSPHTEARPKAERGLNRSGQAMIEFIVSLVAFLALFAGLLQIMTLSMTHSEVMDNARRQAGERALSRSVFFDTPDYIHEWEAGDDERRYSVDDESSDANEADFLMTIVDKAGASRSDWLVLDLVRDNEVSILRYSPSTATRLGLVQGIDSEPVPLLPAVKHLLYDADEIIVKSEIWMPRTTGIY